MKYNENKQIDYDYYLSVDVTCLRKINYTTYYVYQSGTVLLEDVTKEIIQRFLELNFKYDSRITLEANCKNNKLILEEKFDEETFNKDFSEYKSKVASRNEEFIRDLHKYHFPEAPVELFNKIFYYIESNNSYYYISDEIEEFLSEFKEYFRQGI